jgi:hypothetical protein
MARTAPISTLELDSLKNPSNPSLTQEADVQSKEAVARLAYSHWLERQNGDEGSAEEDWLRAERELRERQPARS